MRDENYPSILVTFLGETEYLSILVGNISLGIKAYCTKNLRLYTYASNKLILSRHNQGSNY